ncbi:hypothetical protein [uncultured Aquimarina sp.]|uniref:hypothetical protein n=1 Tax=uncultured Aquimarina sp. TaxID=575652 RepID=UPI00260A8B2C|nr:hypothetical protein [uncultured Aquimarina sp.]
MFDKLNSKSATNTLPHLFGGTAGVAASGALTAVVPEKQKKLVQIAKLVGATVVLMASQGGSKTIKPTSFFLGGVAIESTISLAKDFLGSKINTGDTATTADKAFAGALGLGCPDGRCGSQSTYRALRMPSFDTTFRLEESVASAPKSYR